MAIEGQEGQEPAEPSLRDSLEAAVEVVEAADKPEAAPSTSAEPTQQREGAPEGQVVDLNKPDAVVKLDKAAKGAPEEAAPKSWKAAAQGKWSTVDPEIRAEVHRREKETSRVFGETSGIRETFKQFNEIVQPYAARLQSIGMQPLQAVQQLLRSDYILSSTPGPQRAQYMAQLIKEYGIDIRQLDDALAGQGSTQAPDPVAAQVERMLQERLSPLQQFLNQQQQVAQYQEQQILTEAATTIDQIAQDNVKYPHFDSVREDMADIIEMNAKRNVFLTPDQAYARAVGMNPELGAQMAQQQNNGRQLQQARSVNERAQRALAASSSVSGAPGGSPVGGVGPNASLRDTIEAAFSQVAGR
jgi:hypothetical protein